MDRITPAPSNRAARLPRTRGEGPANAMARGLGDRAPPHPRGWTDRKPLSGGQPRGSPAPAGMDPHRRTPAPAGPGLPRTRGDGPRSGDEVVVRSEEHTTELQTLMRITYAVFCLKKKNNQ